MPDGSPKGEASPSARRGSASAKRSALEQSQHFLGHVLEWWWNVARYVLCVPLAKGVGEGKSGSGGNLVLIWDFLQLLEEKKGTAGRVLVRRDAPAYGRPGRELVLQRPGRNGPPKEGPIGVGRAGRTGPPATPLRSAKEAGQARVENVRQSMGCQFVYHLPVAWFKVWRPRGSSPVHQFDLLKGQVIFRERCEPRAPAPP